MHIAEFTNEPADAPSLEMRNGLTRRSSWRVANMRGRATKVRIVIQKASALRGAGPTSEI